VGCSYPSRTWGLGAQLDLREVTAAVRQQIEDDKGEITDAASAGYIALEIRDPLILL
jgi:hypothetical protein